MCRPVGRPSTFDWANKEHFGGRLPSRLRSWHRAGMTLDKIVRQLEEHDVEVSRETVRRWLAKVAA